MLSDIRNPSYTFLVQFWKHTRRWNTWNIKSRFGLNLKCFSKMLQFSWKMNIFIKIHIWRWKSRFWRFVRNKGCVWLPGAKKCHSKLSQTSTWHYINKTWTFNILRKSTSDFIFIIEMSIIGAKPMKVDETSKVQVFAFSKHLMSNMACWLHKASLKAFPNENLSLYQQNLDF